MNDAGSAGKDIVSEGIFLIDKPEGISSFRVVQYVRRALKIKKVGHAGTLDPFATGLLIVCAGRKATKIISQLMSGDKEYEALIRLGKETDTQDREGNVTAEKAPGSISSDVLEKCLAGFVGEQMQKPPVFSALKHKGKPLYHYARKGIVIETEPRPVTIYELQCLEFQSTMLRIRVRCSKGTYIRTLAADIGRSLGCGAHLEELRRLRSGPFAIEDAIDGSTLADPEKALAQLSTNCMTVDEALKRLTT